MNVIVKKSRVQGKGVYATKDFSESELILDIDDSHEVENVASLTKEQHEFGCDYLANGKVVLMQPPEKFINHSCDPTSYVKTLKGIRKVFAMRNIKKGDEITFDYSINGYNEGTFKCNCGSKDCRNFYQGNFFKLPVNIQLKNLPYLDYWFIQEHKKEIDDLLTSK